MPSNGLHPHAMPIGFVSTVKLRHDVAHLSSPMGLKEIAPKLGYPTIFSASPENAAANLYHLITKQECSIDEGAAHWRDDLTALLEGPHDLQGLHEFGAKFIEDQWRQTLQLMRDDLTDFLDGDGTSRA